MKKLVAFLWKLLPALAGICILTAVMLVLGRFINAPWDEKLLLALNPDHYIPVIDELMVFVTDFSVYMIGWLALSWEIGWLCCRGSATRRRRTAWVFRVLAVLMAAWHMAGIWIHDTGIFWWPAYEYSIIFLPLGICFFLIFFMNGESYVRLESETLRHLHRLFWITLLAIAITSPLVQDLIKEQIARPRPLNDAWSAWNHQLRVIPDETVRGSFSYISGHSSALFTLLTPLFWAVRKPWLRIALFAWAALHAYTRVYTAVHFPYCCIMGSLFGFGVSTIIYFSFQGRRPMFPVKNDHPSEAAPDSAAS
jgi:undecaprenyl-diphosphatase